MSESHVVPDGALPPTPKRPYHFKPKPASPKVAREVVTAFVRDATKAVISGKKIHAEARQKFNEMQGYIKDHIFSLLGPDIEEARMQFANELLANSRKAAQYIMRNFEELPPHVQAFVFTSMLDKSEMLRNKTMLTAKGAQVAIQVNAFGDGTFDREKLVASLSGQFLGEPAKTQAKAEDATKEAIPVKASPQSSGHLPPERPIFP